MEQCCGTCKFHRTDDNGEWESDMSAQYAQLHFCNKEAIDRMIDLLQRMKELWEREERNE